MRRSSITITTDRPFTLLQWGAFCRRLAIADRTTATRGERDPYPFAAGGVGIAIGPAAAYRTISFRFDGDRSEAAAGHMVSLAVAALHEWGGTWEASGLKARLRDAAAGFEETMPSAAPAVVQEAPHAPQSGSTAPHEPPPWPPLPPPEPAPPQVAVTLRITERTFRIRFPSNSPVDWGTLIDEVRERGRTDVMQEDLPGLTLTVRVVNDQRSTEEIIATLETIARSVIIGGA